MLGYKGLANLAFGILYLAIAQPLPFNFSNLKVFEEATRGN